MVAQTVQALGRGLYWLSDVARYTELHERRVRSWFTARSDRDIGPVFTADFPVMDKSHVVSFLDMIDARIAGELRGEGVSMRTIRAAHRALGNDLRTAHPFAHSSLYTDGKRVFADAVRQVGSRALTEVVSRQQFFPRVRRFLTRIDYSPETSLAARWNIAQGVVIDPAVSFGQPVVRGTGVTTYVVAMSYLANRKRAEFVGELFGITQKDVGDAVAFEERYGHLRAA